MKKKVHLTLDVQYDSTYTDGEAVADLVQRALQVAEVVLEGVEVGAVRVVW